MLGNENTWLCVRGKVFAAVFLLCKNCKLFPLFLFFVDYLLSTRQKQQQRQQLSQYENKKQEKVTTTQFGLLTLCCCFSSYSSASVPNIPHLSPHCHRQICVIFMFGGCFRRILRGRTKWWRSEWMYTRSYVHPFICTYVHECMFIHMQTL